MAREADVAHGTRMDATRHERPRGRAARAQARRRWRGHVAWAPRWRHMAGGLAGEGPTG